MISWFFSIAFLGIVLGYLFGRWGARLVSNNGEIKVRRTLLAFCQNREAHVLSHVTLRLEDGSTTQIDHILVDTKGVFIIETKNYSGWIFANPRARVWTQTIYHLKSRFQNPLHQNYKHVKAVQKTLEFLEPKNVFNRPGTKDRLKKCQNIKSS